MLLFSTAIYLVMILRVYAMWNRSKIILGVLLCLYVPQTIISFFNGIINNPNTYFSVTVFRSDNMSFCFQKYQLPSPYWLYLLPELIFTPVLLIVAVFPTFKQSFYMYMVMKKWQPNRYMKLLVRDGIVYFLVCSSYYFINTIGYGPGPRTSSFTISMLFVNALVMALLFTMMPRFIISMRELYDRDLDQRWQGMDNGFGMLSHPSADEDTTMTTIAFVDDTIGQREGLIIEGHIGDSRTSLPEVVEDGVRQA